MEFLKKFKYLGPWPENVTLRAVDAVGLYPNIPHEGLSFLRKLIDSRTEKDISNEIRVELPEILKSNSFKF